MAHRYNVRMFLLWSCTSSIEDIHGSHSQPSTCRKLGFRLLLQKVLDGQLQTLSESEANCHGVGAFFGNFLRRLCAKPHTGCTFPKQFSHESMSTCAEGIIDEEKKILTWFTRLTRNLRNTPQLDSPPVPPPFFQLRFTVRDGHGTELMLRRVGVGEVPFEETPWKPGFGETFQNSARIWGETRPHPTDMMDEIHRDVCFIFSAWKMAFEYEEWVEWLDYIGFRWI